ncbi:OmpH family outer membrane protein [Salisaeta longa]|uniref:OmpH family outer membrane protein n=1 Tax=Salisaeta longa TaxID=503170 RepID=UPI0003B2E3D4|nr:OmpH family outer membrane protein [Salisaeta longa]
MRNARFPWRLAWLGVFVVALCCGARAGYAQQTIGYINSKDILQQLPEYATVQQKLQQLEQEWRAELEKQRAKVEEMESEFEARALLYTPEERKARREAIAQARKAVEEKRRQYFGPNGRFYQRQQELMRPIQERILSAVEEVARIEGYDYVFDKSGDYLFMFARPQYNLNDQVLRVMGVTPNQQQRGARRP